VWRFPSHHLCPADTHSLVLLLEPQASPSHLNLIPRAEALAAAVAARHFNGAAFAEDTRVEFAFVVSDAILVSRSIKADVLVHPGDGGVRVVPAFFMHRVIRRARGQRR
jgi:hypothetical protein